MVDKENKIVYPPGVRDITDDISTDDLVRRLKDCAHAFQNMSQDDDNSAYIPLALHLASETFLEHPSLDVRLLVACCIADVFRVYAPDAPYKDMTQLKIIFEFFVDQLRGLEDPSKSSFKRHFYLLENFSCVKTFNICVELEDNQKILCRLFKLMFKIINENHSAKVKKFILDMLSPLISEADIVSQELLDVILSQIIEPVKSQNRNASLLAQDILKRNISSLEPYIQSFFNNALILRKILQSDVARHLYELIYELNGICPSMLVVVLPQLEFKLKSNEEKERFDVTKVLARMFSDKNSTMIEENKTLWSCFLSRFNDISPRIRIRCVQYAKVFLLNHPESKDDITEQLKQRHRDVDENVRYEVVVAIVNAAKEDFSCINEDLLGFVKDRTLDKKFKIRKEALLSLATLYKQQIRTPNLTPAGLEFISWMKNKVLHLYYLTSLEDRLLVERILYTCLVPYQKPMEERMKLLYQLFCSVDDYAVRAFKEIMKCQSVLRTQVRSILELIQCEKSDMRQKTIATKVSLLSKNLQDTLKSNEYLIRFCSDLECNIKLRSMLASILTGNISCSEAETKVKEILKLLGHPVQTNSYYMIIKQLLERIAPVMVDKEGIRHLVECVKDSLLGDCAIEADLGLHNSSRRGLELLWVLTFVFPAAFHDEQIFNNLLLFLQVEDDVAADIALQIFMNISNDMEINFPDVSRKLLPVLENFVETGTTKQAKHAVYCINSIVSDKEKVFGNIIENLKKHFSLKSQYFRTALVSVGHIAYLCHDMFAADFKIIVAKIVVKDLLMLDQDLPRGGDETWGPLDSLPDETKVKIEGMKVMVRWLTGLKDMVQPAISTLRLLTTVILHDGDLMERQHTAPVENSWMRLSAANCMLKLCQEPNYANVITLDQFQVLAYVMNDKCLEVRDRFAQKVHKGLFTLKLPLQFLALFALAGFDERKEFRSQVKNFLTANISKRKEYIKHQVLSKDKLLAYLPDYSLPFAIHLLTHIPSFKIYNDIPTLLKLKDCLWFFMEPLIVKNENYNYSFFKRLLENIKQTKDKQSPNDSSINLKMYAVCDLALSIILSKKGNFVLKDFPVEPVLPSQFFTDPDPKYSNLKTYLPPELINDKSLKSGFEIEIFEGSQNESSVMTNASSLEISQSIDSILSETSKEKEAVDENSSESMNPKTRSQRKKTMEISKNVSSSLTGGMRSRTRKKNTEKISSNPELTDEVAEKSDSSDEGLKNTSKHSQINHNTQNSKSNNISTLKQNNIRKSESLHRPIRSSRSSTSSSTKSSAYSIVPSDKRNGIVSTESLSLYCSPDVHSSLRECNVSLNKDEVERYIALSSSATDSDFEQNNLSEEDFHTNSRKPNKRASRNSSPTPKKRKREDSPPNHPLKNRITRGSEQQVSNNNTQRESLRSQASPLKSNINSRKPAPKNSNSVKKISKIAIFNNNQSNKVVRKGTPVKNSKIKSKPSSPIKRSQRNEVKTSSRRR